MYDYETTEEIKRDISQLVDDVGKLRREMGMHKKAKFEHLRNDAHERLREAQERATRGAKQVDHYVHEKPWMATGVAAAIGAALGAILVSSKRRRS